MTRSVRRVALCLVALTAVGCIVTATASAAEPIFNKVVVVPLKEGEKVSFTSTGLKANLETVGKKLIVCASSTGQGEVVGPTGMKLGITFKGCESATTKCTSTGAAEGEIVTNGFEGKLGNLKSGSTPGVDLSQLKEKTNDAEFTCGTTKVKLFGGVVGPIVTANKKTTRLLLTYSARSGIQLFENLFGGSVNTFSTSFGEAAAEQTGLVGHITLKFSEEVEITG
jgi:hypothetical protein